MASFDFPDRELLFEDARELIPAVIALATALDTDAPTNGRAPRDDPSTARSNTFIVHPVTHG